MTRAQPGILAPVPRLGRYLFFDLAGGTSPADAVATIAACPAADDVVLGIGAPLGAVEGLEPYPDLKGPEASTPSTQHAVWCWLRADEDRGELVHRTHEITSALAPALELVELVDAFRHGGHAGGHGKDLTGYEDGTENPEGDEAVEAAIVGQSGSSLDGSSFVAVQKWVHDMAAFGAMARQETDHIIGRDLETNEELADAPESAHVKRTEQEGFEPEAFVLRRSMPWAGDEGEGLLFVAFGHSLRAFEVQMKKMLGMDDGITDGLFRISKPVSGGYYWCPPVEGGKYDLGALA